jgi:hypothetical protein
MTDEEYRTQIAELLKWRGLNTLIQTTADVADEKYRDNPGAIIHEQRVLVRTCADQLETHLEQWFRRGLAQQHDH